MIIANLIILTSVVYTGFYLYKRNYSVPNIDSIKPKLLLWTPLEPIYDK